MSEPGLRHWRPRSVPMVPPPPGRLRDWLDEPGSLTARLRQIARDGLQVRVLHERWGRAWPDENARLGSQAMRWHWLREVLLCNGQTPYVYARSVIPLQSLRGPLSRLRQLGRQPLGSLLFGRYPVVRGAIEVARVGHCSRLGQRALAQGARPEWARRSVFHIGGRPLLVTEVFLSPLIEELTHERDHG